MSGERLKLSLASKEHKLFCQGTLIHATSVWLLEDFLLGEGLLSLCQQAKKEGRTISESTMWHPEDNLYVKFLRLPSLDLAKNASALIKHFWDFADPESQHPTGLMVRNGQAVKLFKDCPDWADYSDSYDYPYFYGIKDAVLPQDIEGVIIYTYTGIVEMRDQSPDRLMINPLRIITEFVFETVRKAEEKLNKTIPVLDNFGREIKQQKFPPSVQA